MKYQLMKTDAYILEVFGGEMPNIDFPTMGGHVFWDTVKENDSFKLQVNKITNHARILKSDDVRIAWGTYNAMMAKFKKLCGKDILLPGDVIGVKRIGGVYEHYAVYIGNDEVIHYAGNGGDFNNDISIHQAPISEFLDGSDNFFILDFPDKYGRPAKINTSASLTGYAFSAFKKFLKETKYHIYSAQETIDRAKSRIGESDYNLVVNNCEHFAIWCKTGISESHQVNRIIELISSVGVYCH